MERILKQKDNKRNAQCYGMESSSGRKLTSSSANTRLEIYFIIYQEQVIGSLGNISVKELRIYAKAKILKVPNQILKLKNLKTKRSHKNINHSWKTHISTKRHLLRIKRRLRKWTNMNFRKIPHLKQL